MKTKVAAITISLFLAGCASTNPGRYKNETNAVDMSGAYQLVTRDDFEDIDLVGLVDPKGKAKFDTNGSTVTWDKLNAGQKIDAALDQFYINNPAPADQRIARDRIQERLLAASTQRCNAFKENLQREYSRHNFALGLGSTIAGVVGAVVPGVQASKNLSAAAGIFSGARAEWNQDYLSNIAVNVIIDGIEVRQQEVYKQIVRAGQEKEIKDYNLEAAIKDALFYHGQCSIITGLRVASESIKLANDPGMDAATRMMLKFNNLKKAVEGGTGMDMDLATKLDQLSINQRLLAGTPRTSPPEPSSLLRSLNGTKLKVDKAAGELTAALVELEKPTTGTPAQTAVTTAQTNITGAGGAIETCLTKAGIIMKTTVELQAKLDTSTAKDDAITLAGGVDTQSKRATAVAIEVDKIQSQFLAAAQALQSQITAKTLTKDNAKDIVPKQLGSYATPDICK